MKNEPVAWLWTKNGKPQSALLNEPTTVPGDPYWKDKGFKAIPLYTHPVKELTDEEITEIYYPFSLAKYQFNMASPMFDQLGFARAILRKAQEK